MNILNRKNPTTAAAPELRVPDHLSALYPAALEHVREHVTVLTDRNWFENLSGGQLLAFIADSIAAEKHNGIRPGSVSKPAAMMIEQPVEGRAGAPGLLRKMVPAPEDATPERQQHWEAYRYSSAHEETFTAEVAELTEQILSSPARAWEAYQHLSAVMLAGRQKEQSDQAAVNEQRRLQREQCPVCGDSDRGTIGAVKTRRILDGNDAPYAGASRKLRSCHLCWEYAHDVYLARHAATSTGENRSDLVIAALNAAQPLEQKGA